MPRISVVMVRTALLQLGLGTTIGGLLLAEKGLHLWPWLWLLRQGHVQILLVGWVIQLACGVAVWILPRLDALGGRGNLGLAWLAYAALNGGVMLALAYLPLGAVAGTLSFDWMPSLAGLLYAVAVVALVAHLWRRVLPFRTHPRPDVSARKRLP